MTESKKIGPQRVRFCFDAQHGSHATGKHAETIRYILNPGLPSSFCPNRYISPESAVAHPELPRRTVVMLMEPARKRVNDQARLSGGGGNRNEKEQHYESSEPAYSLCFEDQPVPERS